MIRRLYLQRTVGTNQSTIGLLEVFDTTVHTLEDAKRKHKVAGETRIPAGRYELQLRNEGGMTQRYARRFGDMHKGMIWLRRVPEFEWVYIHPGNTAADTQGCILVGEAHGTDRIMSSVVAYRRIYPLIVNQIQNGGCEIVIFDEVQS